MTADDHKKLRDIRQRAEDERIVIFKPSATYADLEPLMKSWHTDRVELLAIMDRQSRADGSSMSLMQDDMAELLRALGLGDHARPISPHEVMQTLILPAVRALVAIAEGYQGLKGLRR